MKWKQEEVGVGCGAAVEDFTAEEPGQDQAEVCTEIEISVTIETSTETGMSIGIEMSTGILTEMSM
jgi:hypothetical protein